MVFFKFYLSSVNFKFKIDCSQRSCKNVVNTHITCGDRKQTLLWGNQQPGRNFFKIDFHVFANFKMM